ncbi:MAG TPA: PspC domain-containing protein [Candidatus Binatia bacterium]|nr:PspC domain-containing protein [Candidatus Binatia bacterium]
MHERLYRSRTDRVLFGVAGGIADWMDIDPSVVRLVWAILVVFGGAGLVLYIIAAIVIPEEPYEAVAGPIGAPAATVAGDAAGSAATTAGGAPAGAAAAPAAAGWTSYADASAARRAARAARRAERGHSGGIVFGVILILVGAWFLLRAYVPELDDRWLWPSLVVVVGVLLVAAAIRRPPAP